jgi:hypothetical protein
MEDNGRGKFYKPISPAQAYDQLKCVGPLMKLHFDDDENKESDGEYKSSAEMKELESLFEGLNVLENDSLGFQFLNATTVY